jgi:hypothetical protein
MTEEFTYSGRQKRTPDFYAQVGNNRFVYLQAPRLVQGAGQHPEHNWINNPANGISEVYVDDKSAIDKIIQSIRNANIPCGLTPETVSLVPVSSGDLNVVADPEPQHPSERAGGQLTVPSKPTLRWNPVH